MDGIAAAFAQNWAECHDELYDDHDRFTSQEQPGNATVQVVRGSASFGWQDMQTLLRVVITSARERFRLSTAYFAPDAYFIGLLADAARRGVRVEILLPGPHTDQRACLLAGRQHYETLVEAGVEVREYQPTMLHTKIITVDGVCSLIGSSNFNRRSMEHDEEVMLAVLDEDFTAALDADFDADRAERARRPGPLEAPPPVRAPRGGGGHPGPALPVKGSRAGASVRRSRAGGPGPGGVRYGRLRAITIRWTWFVPS